MKVKVHIYFKARDGLTYKRVLSYVNPAASEEVLNNFVTALNALTTNDLKSVLKVVNNYLDEEQASEGEITVEEIGDILSGEFIEVYDSDGVTQVEINAILEGSYTAVADSDEITDAEVTAILANW